VKKCSTWSAIKNLQTGRIWKRVSDQGMPPSRALHTLGKGQETQQKLLALRARVRPSPGLMRGQEENRMQGRKAGKAQA
jgi:hypothetical protein